MYSERKLRGTRESERESEERNFERERNVEGSGNTSFRYFDCTQLLFS